MPECCRVLALRYLLSLSSFGLVSTCDAYTKAVKFGESSDGEDHRILCNFINMDTEVSVLLCLLLAMLTHR